MISRATHAQVKIFLTYGEDAGSHYSLLRELEANGAQFDVTVGTMERLDP